ncbi:phytase [Sandarakinorhabdus limnophila]|jgi:3-phytase|uniref:phytase n=1 Tax=Sandarakinorhabdus limnophila TaxID=210512 RepID=UPI0026F2623C|nr:phytase [Sandarakinorhabdus limnophila]
MRAALPFLLLLAACAPPAIVPVVQTASVTADAETAAVKSGDDAADDPAIWRNAANPAASLIVGTDKQAGLYVYGLDGQVRDFNNAGRVNNVDLVETPAGVIVAASDRSDEAKAQIALFRLNTTTARLEPIGRVPAGAGEAYGMCLWATPRALTAFIVIKDGTIRQIELDTAKASGRIVRSLKLSTQSEGCVVDARTARLYAAEEDVGIWRFDARASGSTTAVKLAGVDGKRLVADVEGLAIAAEGAGSGGWLVASSQGDNAYSVYRLADERFAGRFRIAEGRLGSTQETDGIAVMTGDFGPAFPQGLMVAQDGENSPAQNFKLVGWGKIKAALKLR